MAHDHAHPARAHAAKPTVSLLRMSAAQRLAFVGVVLAGLWTLTALVISEVAP